MKSYLSSSRTLGGESTEKAGRPFFCRRFVNFKYQPLKLEILHVIAYGVYGGLEIFRQPKVRLEDG